MWFSLFAYFSIVYPSVSHEIRRNFGILTRIHRVVEIAGTILITKPLSCSLLGEEYTVWQFHFEHHLGEGSKGVIESLLEDDTVIKCLKWLLFA